MAIECSFSVKENYLAVITKGIEESLNEVRECTSSIVEEAIKNNSRKILCDLRDLSYTLTTLDIYALAEYGATYASKVSKIAMVCQEKVLDDGRFYETVASNRGLTILVTTEYNQALDWLGK
jgi:hypothetical protein